MSRGRDRPAPAMCAVRHRFKPLAFASPPQGDLQPEKPRVYIIRPSSAGSPGLRQTDAESPPAPLPAGQRYN
jgi:hypothetical protein